MRQQKTFFTLSIILSTIGIALLIHWYGWRLALCLFFFEWGRNAYRQHIKQKEDAREEEMNQKLMDILKK